MHPFQGNQEVHTGLSCELSFGFPGLGSYLRTSAEPACVSQQQGVFTKLQPWGGTVLSEIELRRG